MKLKQQVCNLELAKRLKELDVEQDTIFYWREHLSGGQSEVIVAYCPADDDYGDYFSAFTVAELGELLPRTVKIKNKEFPFYSLNIQKQPNGDWWISYGMEEIVEQEDTEADARAKMLIYLIENNLAPKTKKRT